MLRTVGAIVFGLALLLATPAWGAGESLAAAIRARNPVLQALAARVAEARAKTGPAGSLPDPRIEVEVMDARSLGGPRAALRQMLPIAGQPALMRRMAEIDADMKDAERAERELMLLAAGERAIADLAYADQSEVLVKTMRTHAAHMSRVAEARYAAGQGMQPDVLRAHVARTRLLEPSLANKARRRTALATLAALAPGWRPPDQAPTPGPPLPAACTLVKRALRESPMLAMRRLAIAHAEVEAALARAERIPDLEFAVIAGRSMPGDMPYLGGMAMATVPIWHATKQWPRIEAAERRVVAERAALEAAEREVGERLEGALAEVAAVEGRLALYRGGFAIQARQAFRTSLAAYQVGQTDMVMVLDALMVLYDVEMAEAMAIGERRQMAAMALAIAGLSPAADEGSGR